MRNPFVKDNIQFKFATVHSNRLMKKGGGIGPTKPWQPIQFKLKKVPNPILRCR